MGLHFLIGCCIFSLFGMSTVSSLPGECGGFEVVKGTVEYSTTMGGNGTYLSGTSAAVNCTEKHTLFSSFPSLSVCQASGLWEPPPPLSCFNQTMRHTYVKVIPGKALVAGAGVSFLQVPKASGKDCKDACLTYTKCVFATFHFRNAGMNPNCVLEKAGDLDPYETQIDNDNILYVLKKR